MQFKARKILGFSLMYSQECVCSSTPCLFKSLSDHLKFTGEMFGLALGTALPSVRFFFKLNSCLISGENYSGGLVFYFSQIHVCSPKWLQKRAATLTFPGESTSSGTPSRHPKVGLLPQSLSRQNCKPASVMATSCFCGRLRAWKGKGSF